MEILIVQIGQQDSGRLNLFKRNNDDPKNENGFKDCDSGVGKMNIHFHSYVERT